MILGMFECVDLVNSFSHERFSFYGTNGLRMCVFNCFSQLLLYGCEVSKRHIKHCYFYSDNVHKTSQKNELSDYL